MAKDYLIEELKELIDGKIVAVGATSGKYEKYYGIKIVNSRTEQTVVLWFLRDDEGNGPGSFSIEEGDLADDFIEA